MNAIDLFAGCGGLSKGFMDAGFDIIVGVDNDQDALNTFALNHNGAKPLNADLSKQETFDEIKKIAGDKTIDVIIAGPPCQGFSLTGPRNFDDERNKLYLAVIEMVKQYKPINTFKNKVIMYLFEDAAKQKRPRLFEGCFLNSSRYSEICREFEAKGVGIFNHDIQLDCEVEDVKYGDTTQE